MLILGLTAGVVFSVAVFDLMLEAIELARGPGRRALVAWVAVGLGLYMLLERLLERAENISGFPPSGASTWGL